MKYKEKIRNGHNLQENATLDECFYNFMKDKEMTPWNEKLIRNYNLYIGTCELIEVDQRKVKKKEVVKQYKQYKVGHKPISEVSLWHLETILSNMAACKLSERTRNSIFEVLNPLYKWLVSHSLVEENIAADLKVTINVKKQKRIVVNAEKMFQKVYKAILDTYADDPYYKAIFLFALNGRRKGEILGLKWHYIDLENNTYVLEDPKATDHQTFHLGQELKETLLKIPDSRRSYVFKSPLNPGQPLKNIDRHIGKLKEVVQDDKLSLHFFRHVLVSALADKGVSKIQLSALLGHTDLQSINRYISTDRVNAGKKVSPIIEEMLEVLK